MTDAMMLALAIAAPWLAGTLTVRALHGRDGERSPWADVGYGHFVGVLLVTMLMRTAGWIGFELSFAPVVAALAAVSVAAWFLTPRRPERQRRSPSPPANAGLWRALAIVALLLIALRAGTLAIDVLVRPLFPWDAWSQWATKAKVWSALREIVPFIEYEEWLARKPGYTDTAPNYPATVSLLQAWMALSIERWDDALVNLPWLAAFAALGCAVFGQLVRLGVARSWAIIGAYIVLSLPLLDAHVALAGYADLHLAAAYALGVLALAEWEDRGSRSALVLLLACALLLPLLKVPGIAWAGTLLLGAAVAGLGKSWIRIGAASAVILAATVVAGVLATLGKVGASAAAEHLQIAESLVDHLFAFGNWNLLWYLAPLAVVVAWRQAVAMRATSITLVCGFGFLAWTFFFTRAGEWVVDYTTVNRALLHVAPAVAAFATLLLSRAGAAQAVTTRGESVGADADVAPATRQ